MRRRIDRLAAGIKPIAADLNDPSTLRSLPSRLDVVYYTAAADESGEAAYRRAYVEGLDNLLVALAKRGGRPPRLIFTSSTSVYGQTDGGWIDEDSPTEPLGFAGRILLEAETLADAAMASCCLVRLAGIYGPGRTRLIRRARSGEASCTAGVYGNRIHADDAAGFLAHLGHMKSPESLYIGADDDPAPICDVLAWLAARLDSPPPRVVRSIDAPAARGNKRCSNRRLRSSGYQLRFPGYREGYANVLGQT